MRSLGSSCNGSENPGRRKPPHVYITNPCFNPSIEHANNTKDIDNPGVQVFLRVRDDQITATFPQNIDRKNADEECFPLITGID
ncbi:uncharacterized protein PHALS_09522 [Plasmopara halstedii]|uniref:Uncharacterized protein n=1 Tax=Plasmopara halstedii TaxID=4781 RepID=A0A0P1A5U6_PLAHL|nr:uncharacterized protein PHALS_09522 [Plasmopara halstedii]CEG35400.1 hypothetical protein PHALS_09522 [Plasmopara halstedii]|eukprot:XP_024571769.1 hypothetical protein PHALS_09522 [Plasmopara halstedii]